MNIEGNLQAYLGDRKPTARYTSFDYCFNYFQSHREQARLPELLRGEALQLSCLHLGFYLASWGMLRGSADLLQKSARHLVPLVEVIANSSAEIWEMDANMYGDGKCPVVFEAARQIRKALPDGPSDILVTKIMLGTFGCVPAFDTYFKKGFGVAVFGPKALRALGEFYSANSEVIERNRVQTLAFDSGQATERRYTRAKVIDTIFFVEGGGRPSSGGDPTEAGVKVKWMTWEVTPPDNWGHGVGFYDVQIEGQYESRVAFLEGFDWLHGDSTEAVIYCIKPNLITTVRVLDAMKKRIEEILGRKELPTNRITRRITALVNG